MKIWSALFYLMIPFLGGNDHYGAGYGSLEASSLLSDLNNEFFGVGQLLIGSTWEVVSDEELWNWAAKKLNNKNELRNKDYNLDSPIIGDEVDSLIESIKQKSIDPRFSGKRDFSLSYETLKFKIVQINDVKGSKDFHQWFFKRLTNLPRVFPSIPTSYYSYLSKELKSSWEDLSSVYKTFWSNLFGWKPRVVSNFNVSWNERAKYVIQNPTLSLKSNFEGMISMQAMIVLMNSNSTRERENLQRNPLLPFEQILELKDLKMKKEDLETNFIGKMKHPYWGSALITPGFIFFERDNMLIDRNMALMMKDVFTNRFNVELSSRGKYYHEPEKIDCIMDLYALGDKLLKENGTNAYKVIKLLEPLCLNQLTKIAGSIRPKLNRFPKFNKHMEDSVKELNKILRSSDLLYQFVDKINSQNDPNLVVDIFGIYRHWGHPLIDYFEGLRKLHNQTTMPKNIDLAFVDDLASDLSYKILRDQFLKYRKWFVDPGPLPEEHPLKKYISDNLWPPKVVIEDFGHNWHKLPLIQVFNIPESIPLAEILDDKSHSYSRSELKTYKAQNPNSAFPSHKVLQTVLDREIMNPKNFLEKVDKEGISKDQLVMGLKGKEREMKNEGRFFCLMSEEIRSYFVLTEMLIKKNILPLFESITMADSFNDLTKKLMSQTLKQGTDDYTEIGISNHLDYEKWNNHQRYDSTAEVFKVLDKFFGLSNVFTRTHKIFEDSWIYYGDRGDLIDFRGDTIINKSNELVCWNGQAGGLEGLRQKGWCLISLLMIEREASFSNTKVQTLAQGDNQVITCAYQLPKNFSEDTLDNRLNEIIFNNNLILSGVREGARRLGLIINEDETIQSADLLVYGKIPIFRGNILCSETKRWSRVSCLSNDQLPSLSSMLSTTNTSAITVFQQSDRLDSTLINHSLFSFISLWVIDLHNPILGMSREQLISSMNLKGVIDKNKNDNSYYLRGIFLDPIVGGVSGMPLTRFLIRQFPDPLTECLSFYKVLGKEGKTPSLRETFRMFGNPEISAGSEDSWWRLIENPTSINNPQGLSAATLIKNEIRKALISIQDDIKNKEIQYAVKYMDRNRDPIINYLKSITPLFPRFLSEFYSSTFLGYTESIIGLFQNAKTIRNLFHKHFSIEVGEKLVRSELKNYHTLLIDGGESSKTWNCSSSLADKLRERSWGRKTVGTTVPHPFELLGRFSYSDSDCGECSLENWTNCYISTVFPSPLNPSVFSKGGMNCYLGSSTASSSSIFKPWEKISEIPTIKKAMDLREAINWFVDGNSNLSRSIFNNIGSLTGVYENPPVVEFQRTGSALHRFRSSRYSNGGYCASGYNWLTYCFVTTDTMGKITQDSKNWDFLFQGNLLYSQLVSSQVAGLDWEDPIYKVHSHIKCESCLRPIEEVKLNSAKVFRPSPINKDFLHMIRTTELTREIKTPVNIQVGDFNKLETPTKSFHLGFAQGFMGMLNQEYKIGKTDSTQIFPNSVFDKVHPEYYCVGLVKAAILGSLLNVFTRLKPSQSKDIDVYVIGGAIRQLELLSKYPGFQDMCDSDNFRMLFSSQKHKPIPSYPPDSYQVRQTCVTYLSKQLFDKVLESSKYSTMTKYSWIFSDFNTHKLKTLFNVGHSIILEFYKGDYNKFKKLRLKELCGLFNESLSLEDESFSYEDFQEDWNRAIGSAVSKIYSCDQELRHAAKDMKKFFGQAKYLRVIEEDLFGERVTQPVDVQEISKTRGTHSENDIHMPSIPQLSDPLISGLRLVQINTGAFYKIRDILNYLALNPKMALIGGDGSGGISSLILRKYSDCFVIFNSLLETSGQRLRGLKPGQPPAISELKTSQKSRCLNLDTVWESPGDLKSENTWNYFRSLEESPLDLMIFDMEVVSISDYMAIIDQLTQYLRSRRHGKLTIIIKIYASSYIHKQYDPVQKLSQFFDNLKLITTKWTSSFSSEMYLTGEADFKGIDSLHYRVNSASLYSALMCCRANASMEDEFERACSLPIYDQLLDAPERMIPDLRQSLIFLLRKNKLETESIDLLVKTLEFESMNHGMILLSTLLSIITLIWDKKFPVSLLKRTPHFPPSLHSIGELMSSTLGIIMFIAYKVENLSLYRLCHQLFNRGGLIFFRNSKRKIAKTGEYLWSLEWSLTEEYRHVIPYQSMLSSKDAAMWIRCLSILCSHGFPISSSGMLESLNEHDRLISQVNKRCQLKWTGMDTGLSLFWGMLFPTSIADFTQYRKRNGQERVFMRENERSDQVDVYEPEWETNFEPNGV